jgi:hypothetical protein
MSVLPPRVAGPNSLSESKWKGPGASFGERYTCQASLMGTREAEYSFTPAVSVENPSEKNTRTKRHFVQTYGQVIHLADLP